MRPTLLRVSPWLDLSMVRSNANRGFTRRLAGLLWKVKAFSDLRARNLVMRTISNTAICVSVVELVVARQSPCCPSLGFRVLDIVPREVRMVQRDHKKTDRALVALFPLSSGAPSTR